MGVAMRLLPVLVSVLLSSCAMYDSTTGPVSEGLKKELRSAKAAMVDLKAITTFEWDELVLFAPYESTNEICRKLALDTRQCRSKITVASNADEEMVMVFRRNGDIVHVERHDRFNGDFAPTKETQTILAANAVFAVTTKGASTGGEPWLVLTRVSSPATSNPAAQGTLRAGTAWRRSPPHYAPGPSERSHVQS